MEDSKSRKQTEGSAAKRGFIFHLFEPCTQTRAARFRPARHGDPSRAAATPLVAFSPQGKLLETYANSVRICAWCQGHAWNLMKKGGRYAWVMAAISIVTIVPLIFEVEREVQVLELEELQVCVWRARARARQVR